MAVVIDGTSGITTPALDSTGASTFTGALALPVGGLNVGSGQLAVDASGRVTMPNQPAFRAKQTAVTTYTSLGSGAVIQYDTAQLNIGSHFSTTTFRFTAPVSGTYFFSWGHLVQSKSGGNSVYSNVFINGVRLFPQAWQKSSSNEFTVAYSAVFFMTAGDYAEHRLSSNDSSVALYPEETGFSGYLLG